MQGYSHIQFFIDVCVSDFGYFQTKVKLIGDDSSNWEKADFNFLFFGQLEFR